MKISTLALLASLAPAGCAGLVGADFDDKVLCESPCDIHAPPTLAPAIVATAQSALGDIAADGTNLYWIDGSSSGSDGKVLACDGAACPGGPRVLSSLQEGPRGLAIGGANAYWGTYGGEIVACPVAGCAGEGPTPFVTREDAPDAIAVDSERLYWAETHYSEGRILSCPLAGCGDAPTVLADAQEGASMLAVAGGYVVWAHTAGGGSGGLIHACSADGCEGGPVLLASAQTGIGAIATDGKSAFWTVYSGSGSSSSGRVMTCALGGCGDNPTTVVSTDTSPRGVAVDAGTLFFTDPSEHAVRKCALAECPSGSSVLAAQGNAEEPPLGLGDPSALVVVGNEVIWTSPDEHVVASAER